MPGGNRTGPLGLGPMTGRCFGIGRSQEGGHGYRHWTYSGSFPIMNLTKDQELNIRIFLMNDAVDLARVVCKPPEGYFNLGQMLKKLVEKGVPVKVCGTCKSRCGIYKNEPYFEGTIEAKMNELAEWIKNTNKVISF